MTSSQKGGKRKSPYEKKPRQTGLWIERDERTGVIRLVSDGRWDEAPTVIFSPRTHNIA